MILVERKNTMASSNLPPICNTGCCDGCHHLFPAGEPPACERRGRRPCQGGGFRVRAEVHAGEWPHDAVWNSWLRSTRDPLAQVSVVSLFCRSSPVCSVRQPTPSAFVVAPAGEFWSHGSAFLLFSTHVLRCLPYLGLPFHVLFFHWKNVRGVPFPRRLLIYSLYQTVSGII